MYNTDYGGLCGPDGDGSCPKCDCGTHAVGDSWLMEDIYWLSCVNCTCSIDRDGREYVECENIEDSDGSILDASCDTISELNKSESIECHAGHSSTATGIYLLSHHLIVSS